MKWSGGSTDQLPLAESDLARRLDLPRAATRDVAAMLVRAGVLRRVESGTGEPLLLPARDSSRIALLDVIDAVDGADGDPHFLHRHYGLRPCNPDWTPRRRWVPSAHILLRDMELPGGAAAAERKE